jgi:DNA helicase HerA-like ATPase
MSLKTSCGKQAEVQAILGTRGSGKTTLLNRLLKTKSRVFLVLPSHDEAFQNFTHVHTIDQARILSAERARFRIAFVMDPNDKLGFEYLSRLAYIRGNCEFAVDELHEYVPNVFGGIPKYFKKLCLHGRHRDVGVIGVSQRPANVHKDFFSQAHRLFIFRTIYPGDIDALKRIVPNVQRAATFKVGEHIAFP